MKTLTDGLTDMARWIFEINISLATLMAIYSFLTYILRVLSLEKNHVLAMVESLNFAVSANFRLKPLFN